MALTARTITSLREIAAADWNALLRDCAGELHPFARHEFLAALETSGSVCETEGWAPTHLLVEDDGELIGAAPVYLKFNSQGEYVFDHHWADAFERAGGRYYPKLLCATPFTPAAGPRLIARTETAKAALCEALKQITIQNSLSSAHVNFVQHADEAALCGAEFDIRYGVQYHWRNKGYSSFDDFLAALSSRKRKAIRRERRDALNNDLAISTLTGDQITPAHWDAFWVFYQDTGSRKWGRPYLTRAFFSEIAATMPEQIMMVLAHRDGAPVAGALNFIAKDTLFGRYWGCTEHHPFLHFEVCYYQAIDFAIDRGLARVEAGAQGEHKIARGYEPVKTASAHWIAHPQFREAIAHYLEQERQSVSGDVEYLEDFTPYKNG